jgi:hypothetical protein
MTSWQVESRIPTLRFGIARQRDLHHFHGMSRGSVTLVQR